MSKKKIKLIFIICLIISGISLIFVDNISSLLDKISENKKIELFFENNEKDFYRVDTYRNQYVLVLSIPKINLKKGIYSYDSYLNNVDFGIEILCGMPGSEKSPFVLASHSGTSSVSFFKNLVYLEKDDLIYVYYNKEKYVYKITFIYEKNKDGYLSLSNLENKHIVLTTCKSDKKQLVALGTLLYKADY